MIFKIIQGIHPSLHTPLRQPYYYSYLYIQVRKNDIKSKSAKEIVVENLETINNKNTDFFSNQNWI